MSGENKYSRKLNESEARERLRRFWNNQETDRPALNMLAPNPDHTPNPMDWKSTLKDRDFSAPYCSHTAYDCIQGGLFLYEKMPVYHINPGSGLAMMAILAGYDFRYNGKTAWIDEVPDLLEEAPPEQWETNSERARNLEFCYTEAAERIKGLGFLSSPNLLDPVTVLSQLAGAEELALTMLDEPERVREWIGSLTDLYLHIFNHFSDLANVQDSEVFFGPTAEGRSAALQCDFSVMLSPDMFKEFVLPSLKRIASAMPMTLYHLDGVEQMRFLDHLQTIPQLKGIQWNPQQDYFKPSRHLRDLHEIKERGLILYVAVDTVEEAISVTKALGPKGLFIRFRDTFASREAAEKAVEQISAQA